VIELFFGHRDHVFLSKNGQNLVVFGA